MEELKIFQNPTKGIGETNKQSSKTDDKRNFITRQQSLQRSSTDNHLSMRNTDTISEKKSTSFTNFAQSHEQVAPLGKRKSASHLILKRLSTKKGLSRSCVCSHFSYDNINEVEQAWFTLFHLIVSLISEPMLM